MPRILIIDDDTMVGDILSTFIQSLGHDVEQARTLTRGFERLGEEPPDVVILDVRLPDGNGLQAIPRIKDGPSAPEVIIITGEGNADGAQLAIESGSWDYLQKPLSTEKVRLSLSRALQYHERKVATGNLLVLQREGLVGGSQPLRDCLAQVAGVAPSDTNVLITGETGTGKELFAKAIHANSPRARGPFVVVDCGVLPESLVESVLFGHEKGAFTGAERNADGLVKEAHGGTLFLDEVGELPAGIQSSLLRVLQERRFRSVGGRREQVSDFRLIAATNRDLGRMVGDGEFRSDLYYRLKSTVIRLPALRQRTSDIKELTLHFIARFAERNGIGIKGTTPEFHDALLSYPWPGNVRELANSIETALVSAKDEPTLHPVFLPVEIRSALARASFAQSPPAPESRPTTPRVVETSRPLRDILDEVSRNYLEDLLVQTDWNMAEVCRISGISRANLYARLKKYGIARRS